MELIKYSLNKKGVLDVLHGIRASKCNYVCKFKKKVSLDILNSNFFCLAFILY